MTIVGERYARVVEMVRETALRCGRDPAEVRLIGVTKTVGRPEVDAAYAAGLRDFGENRVQDAQEKFSPVLPADARLHLIGHLQTNKVRPAVKLFDFIHSVDRSSLLLALDREAARQDREMAVLIQVNVAAEPQKHGCRPEELPALLDAADGLDHVRVVGLMTIAPLVDDADEVRWVFRSLRELRDEMRHAIPRAQLTELSMGMTNDFTVAVEEGATMVRVGRAIFGS